MRKLYESTILKLNDFVSGTTVIDYLKEFRQVKNYTPENVHDYQFNKLKRLLIHAEKHSEFYHDRFSEIDFASSNFNSLNDLKKLPVLERSDLLQFHKKIISDKHQVNNLYKGSSSGSTGEPIIFYSDQDAKSAGKAAGLLAWELTPWNFGLKGLHIWGHPETVEKQWNNPMSKMKAKLYRHHKFPAHLLTEGSKFDELYSLCKKEHYRFIDGYTMSMYMFAKYLQAHGLKLPTIEFVLTTGENLQEIHRNVIENNIGPVFDLYGCSEINGIANECSECGKYHTIDPHVIFEYSEPVNKEGDCKLIITDLDNYAFPLIRYENGDIGKPGGITGCSVPFGTIESISGRVADLIELEDGGVLSVPGFFASTIFKKAPDIQQYQIVRDEIDHIIVKLVVASEFDKNQLKVVENEVSAYLDGKVAWTIELVDSIPVSASGKYKLVVDLVK